MNNEISLIWRWVNVEQNNTTLAELLNMWNAAVIGIKNEIRSRTVWSYVFGCEGFSWDAGWQNTLSSKKTQQLLLQDAFPEDLQEVESLLIS